MKCINSFSRANKIHPSFTFRKNTFCTHVDRYQKLLFKGEIRRSIQMSSLLLIDKEDRMIFTSILFLEISVEMVKIISGLCSNKMIHCLFDFSTLTLLI